MPSFRGEQTDETHLAQFMHSEAELPGSLDEIMNVVEDYLRRLCGELAGTCADLIARATGDLSHLDRVLHDPRPFVRLTFDNAVAVLNGDPRWVRTDDGYRTLTRAGEYELMARCGPFVWVTHWDHKAVPFYQAVDARGRALNADLLFGPGEVVGAGQRHTTHDEVAEALRSHGVAADHYTWYVDMKRITPMQTSGFGLGIERFLMWLLGHDDIRDMQIFLRENGRHIAP
jgi:asparaginyl-tRNA synthetase